MKCIIDAAKPVAVHHLRGAGEEKVKGARLTVQISMVRGRKRGANEGTAKRGRQHTRGRGHSERTRGENEKSMNIVTVCASIPWEKGSLRR